MIDELSLGLAPIIVDRLLARLTDIAKSRNVAVLLVEQQARRGRKVADRWYLMRRGQVVGEGDTDSGAAGLEAAYLADHDHEHAPADRASDAVGKGGHAGSSGSTSRPKRSTIAR